MDLNDLDITKISDMSVDESLEMIRQIRLSRRTENPTTKTRKIKAKAKAKVTKTSVNNLTPEQALEVLRLLGEVK